MPDNVTDRPLVTFALLAYNQEEFIREAVEGAFALTYEQLEIILSDDCSIKMSHFISAHSRKTTPSRKVEAR